MRYGSPHVGVQPDPSGSATIDPSAAGAAGAVSRLGGVGDIQGLAGDGVLRGGAAPSSLPIATLEKSDVTPDRRLTLKALRVAAPRLRKEHLHLCDMGGKGSCLFDHVARAAAALGRGDPSWAQLPVARRGERLREMAVLKLREPGFLALPLGPATDGHQALTVREGVIASFLAWKPDEVGEATLELYLELMAQNETYGDNMMILALAEVLKARLSTRLIDSQGDAVTIPGDDGKRRPLATVVEPLTCAAEWDATLLNVENTHFVWVGPLRIDHAQEVAAGMSLLAPGDVAPGDAAQLNWVKMASIVHAMGERFAETQGTTLGRLAADYQLAEDVNAAKKLSLPERTRGTIEIDLRDLLTEAFVTKALRELEEERFARRRRPAPYLVRVEPSRLGTSFHALCSGGQLRGADWIDSVFGEPLNQTITISQDGVCMSGLILRPHADTKGTAYILASYTRSSARRKGMQRLLVGVLERELRPARMVRQANATPEEDRVQLCMKLGFEQSEWATAFVRSPGALRVLRSVLIIDGGDCVAMGKRLTGEESEDDASIADGDLVLESDDRDGGSEPQPDSRAAWVEQHWDDDDENGRDFTLADLEAGHVDRRDDVGIASEEVAMEVDHDGAREPAGRDGPHVTWADPLVDAQRDYQVEQGPPAWPITDKEQLRAYLDAIPDSEEVHLVAFEFSGALLTALIATGKRAIGCDRRRPEHREPYYCGDVWDVVPLRKWACAWFVGPPCFQHLRHDDYLPIKIGDGRAYFAGLQVLMCICCSFARAVFVEQPDTIGHDYINVSLLPGVHVLTVRTSQYGDKCDKFMRFTVRNLRLRPPPLSGTPAREAEVNRSQYRYANADERDRQRSTWKHYPLMCQNLASAQLLVGALPPEQGQFQQAQLRFAQWWAAAGHPVPFDGLHWSGRPTTYEGRRNQEARGAGRRGRTDELAVAFHGGEAPPIDALLAFTQGDQATPPQVAVVPVTTHDGQRLAFVSTSPEGEGHLEGEGDVKSLVQRAERAVRRAGCLAGELFGFRAGTSESGKKLVVVAGEEPATAKDIARTPQERREARRAGISALWCTLAALGGHTVEAAQATALIELALVAHSQYSAFEVTTTQTVQRERALREVTGFNPGRTALMGPARVAFQAEHSVTPRQLIGRAQRGLTDLRHALAEDDGAFATYLAEGADAILPLRLSEVPTDLLDAPLYLADAALKGELFARRLPIYELPWLQRQPPQVLEDRPGCERYAPRHVGDLVDSRANADMEKWWKKLVKDYACIEEHGAACDRKDKPPALAIGQDQFHPCAQGYFWDCRVTPCVLLDYSAPLVTSFDLDYLRRRLTDYPDQRLASNVLEGIRLEADVEQQIVLLPPLESIVDGYNSVQKTARELRGMSFYQFFRQLMFAPCFIIGQGSMVKKLADSHGEKKYRRTSNFSGPHKEVRDKKGRLVTPINAASRCYTVPNWLAQARDLKRQKWSRQRYAHVPLDGADPAKVSSRYKFPKEHKPSVRDVARDVTLLLRASLLMGEALFVWVEDAAFYFNQFAYAPEEFPKSTFIVSARDGDLDALGEAFAPGQLVFVSEQRLGFGSFASSNIAQRFSNAMVEWTLSDFDAAEASAFSRDPSPTWRDWINERRPLEDKCRQQRPKQKGQARTDCTQTRLATIHMYTDDPIMIAVGVQRAKRLMLAWKGVTHGVRLTMAGADKRQVGGHVEWIGVLVMAAIGVLVIPKNKLVRAKDALLRTKAKQITFGEYRALVGLLEHLRFVAQLTADTTNVLYRPHAKGGQGRDGPSTVIRPDAEMVALLDQWLAVITSCAGALCVIAFASDATPQLRTARVIFCGSADAAGDGDGTPGFGGYLHGFHWRVPLPLILVPLMHITAWETLATAVNILVAARIVSTDAFIALRADALLTPYAIAKQRSSSVDVQNIVQLLLSQADYNDDIARRLVLEHLSGDGNIPADYVSRGLWDQLSAVCRVLRVQLTHVPLDEREQRLITTVIERAAARQATVLPADLPALLFDGDQVGHPEADYDSAPSAFASGLDSAASDCDEAPTDGPVPPRRGGRGLRTAVLLAMLGGASGQGVVGHIPGWNIGGERHDPRAPAAVSIPHPGCSELWCDFREYPSTLPFATIDGRGGEYRTEEDLLELLRYADASEPNVLYAIWDPWMRGQQGAVRPSSLAELRREVPQAWYIANDAHDPADTPPGMRSSSAPAGANLADAESEWSSETEAADGGCIFCMADRCECYSAHGSPPQGAALADRGSLNLYVTWAAAAVAVCCGVATARAPARRANPPTPHTTAVRAALRLRGGADSPTPFRPAWTRQEPRAAGDRPTPPPVKRTLFKPGWARGQATARAAATQQAARARQRSTSIMQQDKEGLRADQEEEVQRLARRLAADRTPGRIDLPADQLYEVAAAVQAARVDGANPRTASKNAFAWREFKACAAHVGFDPNLRTEWTRRFPERESLKLSYFLFYRTQRIKPRSKRDADAKPMSVYQNYLALRRVFRERGQELPSSGAVQATQKGLIKRWIARNGIEALRTRRVEPITPHIIRRVLAAARTGAHVLRGVRWTLSNWNAFIVMAWMVINLSVGSRKGESTRLPGDESSNDWFTRRSLTWNMSQATIVDPTETQLRSLKEGDFARLAPKGAKCDPYGMGHGTEPIVLPYHNDDLNAAKWLAEIEMRWPSHGEHRDTLPLFSDEAGEPFTDSRFAGIIMAVLTLVLGPERAALFSPHSWRVWLASALRVAGAPDPLIQALGRWMNPESIKIYARLGTEEYKHWIDKMMTVTHIDATRTTNLPPLDQADVLRLWWEDAGGATARQPRTRDDRIEKSTPGDALATGSRVSVFWTDMDTWFTGTVSQTRVEPADDGGSQRATQIIYDAVDNWTTARQLTYWHCLDDENWEATE